MVTQESVKEDTMHPSHRGDNKSRRKRVRAGDHSKYPAPSTFESRISQVIIGLGILFIIGAILLIIVG